MQMVFINKLVTYLVEKCNFVFSCLIMTIRIRKQMIYKTQKQ